MGTGIGVGIGVGLNKRKSWSTYLATQSKFFMGEFDFDNNKIIDLSNSHNDADLVDGFCLEVLTSVTIVLKVKRVGATVIEVNRTAVTTGVTINASGDIVLVAASLPDTKLETIRLSTGEEFKLTTGISPYVFASNNMGTLSGVVGTDWAWSTKNGLLLNLKEGCSIYPAALSALNMSGVYFSLPQIVGTVNHAWEAVWEGLPLPTGTSYKVPVMSFYPPVSGYTNVLMVNRLTKQVTFGVRTDAWVQKTFTGEELNGWLKFKVTYNGRGAGVAANFQIYLNDVLLDMTAATPTNEERTNVMSYFGFNNGSTQITQNCLFKEVYYSMSDAVLPLFKDDLTYPYNMVTKPSGYMYIPVFDGVDALGMTPTNPAHLNAHNGCEVKVKMKETAELIAADVNNILFSGGVAKSLDLNMFYPSFGQRIFIDNHNRKEIRNLIVLSEDTDKNIASFVNGFAIDPPRFYLRSDIGGSNDVEAPLFGDLVQQKNIAAEAHTGPEAIINTQWQDLVQNGNLSFGLHMIVPSFFKFATYSEGYQAYINSPIGSQEAQIVMPNMGQIGCFSDIDPNDEQFSALSHIINLHNLGFPYPDGVTPAATDDNHLWWDWMFNAITTIFGNRGFEFIAMSEHGVVPNGGTYYNYHEDFEPILNNYIYGNTTHWNKAGYEYTDDLANNVSIFGAKSNATIIEDDSVNVEKLSGYGGTAYGTFDLGANKDWMESPRVIIKFKVKTLQTSGNLPIGALHWGWYSTNINFLAAGVNANGIITSNPCSVDTWYEVVLTRTNANIGLKMYTLDGVCVFNSPLIPGIFNSMGEFLIKCDGIDALFKDVSVKALWDNNYYQRPRAKIEHLNFTGLGYTSGDPIADHLEAFKQYSVRAAAMDRIVRVFTHYVSDPVDKRDVGTIDGLYDRSYDFFSDLFDFYKNNGWRSENSFNSLHETLSTKRKNYIPNGDMSDNYLGLTGEIWGMTAGDIVTPTVVKDDTETINNSIDGTNIVKLSATTYLRHDITPPVEGVYWLQFWAKGTFTISINNGQFEESKNTTNQFVATNYTFYKMPILAQSFGPQNIVIKFYADTDVYLHKLAMWRDGATYQG